MTLPSNATRLPHTVSDRPFDPEAIYKYTDAQKALFEASQLRLMWWKFRRHKPALISGIFLGLLYFSILISEFLAPYNLETRNSSHIYAPPQSIHLFHEGSFIGPFVYGFDFKLNMENLKREYTPNPEKVQPLRFFCSGDKYKFWGLVEARFHFVCPAENGTFFLLGTDRLGRDVLSRMIYGARISLTIGLLGVGVSLVLGIVIGGMAGYYGGLFDVLSQRLIEVIQSLPSIPLWLALAAILPITWSPIVVYFGITVILGETTLSFLGLGLRPPITSWGVLLNEAQNINAVALYPWLLWPVLPVVLVVLAYNFFGDGLRDAADPYK